MAWLLNKSCMCFSLVDGLTFVVGATVGVLGFILVQLMSGE